MSPFVGPDFCPRCGLQGVAGTGHTCQAPTDTDGYPKLCCLCGGRIVKKAPAPLWFHYDHERKLALSWHVRCGTPFMKGV